MREDETSTGYGRRRVDVAQKVILTHGGEKKVIDDRTVWRIAVEKPASVERLPQPIDRLEELRSALLPRIRQDLTGTTRDRVRAAYLAMALGEAETLAADRPIDWQEALAALKTDRKLLKALFKAPPSAAKALQDRARAAGLEVPTTSPS